MVAGSGRMTGVAGTKSWRTRSVMGSTADTAPSAVLLTVRTNCAVAKARKARATNNSPANTNRTVRARERLRGGSICSTSSSNASFVIRSLNLVDGGISAPDIHDYTPSAYAEP